MNLKLKHTKYSSLSLISGSAKPIPFTISELPITTLFDKLHKYLGPVIGPSASSNAGFLFIRDKLSTLLSNINSFPVRSEFKL